MKVEEPMSFNEPRVWYISFRSHGVSVFISVLSSSLHYMSHFLAEARVMMHFP